MERENPKVSVIVAVYKAENYLHRCVDSLLAQTFTDFEILLVDDGSPDRSGEICDAYARRDSRVRVIHKENGGVSSARQCGMDNARGEYTIHADPDDWVEPNMLEELYQKAVSEQADMMICDYYEDRKGKSIYVKQQPSALDHETVLRELFQQLHGSCWNKLVRRVCYSQYNVKFPLELSFSEDLYVNICLASHPLKISYLHKAFYHYDQCVNPDSLVHRPFNDIAAQKEVLKRLLHEALPADSYFRFVTLQYFKDAKIAIVRGERLSTFRQDYACLKGQLWNLPVGIANKLALWTALYISPRLVHVLYKTSKKLKSI